RFELGSQDFSSPLGLPQSHRIARLPHPGQPIAEMEKYENIYTLPWVSAGMLQNEYISHSLHSSP
ncbi:MAG: hypothetical protein QXD15_06065, partial [Thermoplasmata archaeon]